VRPEVPELTALSQLNPDRYRPRLILWRWCDRTGRPIQIAIHTASLGRPCWAIRLYRAARGARDEASPRRWVHPAGATAWSVTAGGEELALEAPLPAALHLRQIDQPREKRGRVELRRVKGWNPAVCRLPHIRLRARV